ncbi:hypothetical protein NQZ68_016381 [Dissostichus eleginoides]|nr:hypothetical protein NQZ68_016381 [Dissostichus eleginoides]
MFKSGVVTTLLDNATGRKERENSLFAVCLGSSSSVLPCVAGVCLRCVSDPLGGWLMKVRRGGSLTGHRDHWRGPDRELEAGEAVSGRLWMSLQGGYSNWDTLGSVTVLKPPRLAFLWDTGKEISMQAADWALRKGGRPGPLRVSRGPSGPIGTRGFPAEGWENQGINEDS